MNFVLSQRREFDGADFWSLLKRKAASEIAESECTSREADWSHQKTPYLRVRRLSSS
jgi:hypothetical protein